MSRSSARATEAAGEATAKVVLQAAGQLAAVDALAARFAHLLSVSLDGAHKDRTAFYQQLLEQQSRIDTAALSRKLGLSDFPLSPEQYVAKLIEATRRGMGCSREQAVAVILSAATTAQSAPQES